MRDIRSELRERLQATMRQRMELGEQLQALDAREQRLRALLQDEELVRGRRRELQLLPLPIPSEGVRLREFVVGSLGDGHAWSLEELKEHARGVGLMTVGASGRSLNITLVNLLREALVRRLPNGQCSTYEIRDTQLALDLALPNGRSKSTGRRSSTSIVGSHEVPPFHFNPRKPRL